jgi:ATP-dependent RNA helicase DeaD
MGEIFDPSITFAQLGLGPNLLKGVEDAGFVYPTDIQARLIPLVLAGKDVIGQAKTGTGKTAAFALPILNQLTDTPAMQVLILVPTRELAAQVTAEIGDLGKHTAFHCACIVGGESMRAQVRAVHQGAHILVGTPGRVMDLQGRGEIHFRNLRFVVLDEVDRMLDIGFRDDIRQILKSVPGPHQTIFCSATISPDIERLGRSFMKPDATRIQGTAGSLTVSLVDQKYLPVQPWDKRSLLLHLLRSKKPDTSVIFCRTKATVHRVTTYLREHGINVREIHGDLAQAKRNSVMESFREGNLDVLVASDLAARGLDIEHISHVINYDLPDDPEVYVHRIGRTARAGRRGTAWSFVMPDQGQLLTEIEKLCGLEIEPLPYPEFKPGPVPDDMAREQARANRPAVDPIERLTARAAPTPTTEFSPEEMARRFPGGVVPQNAPPATLGRHFKSRRRR